MKFPTLLLLLCFATSITLNAQKKLKSFSFKKGEVLDILLLTSAPDSKELFDRYKKTAFPVAFEYSYRPQPGFRISKLTMGNHLPNSLIFGKWGSLEKREGFLANIAKRVPDFHEQRRDNFTYFGLNYYVMPKDLEFSVDTDKYNVVTSLWQHDNSGFKQFVDQWEKQVSASGGKVIIQLKDGTSPTGYFYQPDMFYIVQWEDQAAFESFAKNHPLSSYDKLKNVHQFAIN